jgi:hypothetical protein
MKPRTGPVDQSAKHQLKFLTQELKRPDESITELYVRALKLLQSLKITMTK